MVYLLVTNNEPFISLSPAETCNSDEAHCATSRIRKGLLLPRHSWQWWRNAVEVARFHRSSMTQWWSTLPCGQRWTRDYWVRKPCYVTIDSQERFVPLFLFFGTGGEWNKIYWFYGRKYIRSNWNRNFFLKYSLYMHDNMIKENL